MGKWSGMERDGKERARERKGKGKGGEESSREGREGGRREREEEKGKVKGKGGILCSCDFSLRKTLWTNYLGIRCPGNSRLLMLAMCRG